jgi:protein O-mannosyl-transferase
VRRWWPLGAIVALAIIASASSLGNGFAYDDVPIIVGNAPLHVLGSIAHRFAETYWPADQGGALYRPLTTAVFTVEWALGGGSPLPFHIVNVVLYAAVCLTVYALCRRLVSPAMAFAGGALYAVDPVHVEAFANSVGLSELITALTVVGATVWYIDRRRAGHLRGRDIIGIAGLYAVGCLTKEYAVVLPALLVAAEVTVIDTGRRWPDLRLLLLSLSLVAIAYLALRIRVVGSLVGENPAIPLRNATYATRWWTMLGVIPEWVRLLVWPAHLAAVYSPPGTPVLAHADATAVIGAGLLLAVGVLAVAGRRQVPVATFGIVWIGLILLPISNVVVKSGVLLAERTLFLPSVGAVLVLGAIVPLAARRFPQRGARLAAAAVLVFVLGAGAWRSATRASVWHDNDTLFAQSIVDEPLSYAAHYSLAGLEFNAKRYGTAEREARLAIRLYQDDPRLFVDLAKEYERIGQCDAAMTLARRALVLSPHYVMARLILARCLAKAGDYAALHSVAVEGVADGYQPRLFRQILFTADSGARAASAGRH